MTVPSSCFLGEMQQRPLDSKMSTTTSMRFSQFQVVHAHEPMSSFWWENLVHCSRHLSTMRLSKNAKVE